jgi:hypothetical protein
MLVTQASDASLPRYIGAKPGEESRTMQSFYAELQEQRWDDHRYYHHNRINQSLHFVSSLAFIVMYVLLFTQPVAGVLLGWLFAMTTRQVGHFFFEPKDFDIHNQATHEYKEDVKLGYNLKRKVILFSVLALASLAFYLDPTMQGLFEHHTDNAGLLDHLTKVWLAVGVGGLLFRTVHLFFLKNVQTGVVWFCKILTDPFHDLKLYHRAPIQLLRGELYDPAGPRRHHA